MGSVGRPAAIRRLAGVEVKGFRHTISSDGVAHALKRRGQSSVDTADLAKARSIVRSPDKISLGTPSRANGQPRLVYEKTIDGRRHVYVGEIQNGKRRIEMVTMWKV